MQRMPILALAVLLLLIPGVVVGVLGSWYGIKPAGAACFVVALLDIALTVAYKTDFPLLVLVVGQAVVAVLVFVAL